MHYFSAFLAIVLHFCIIKSGSAHGYGCSKDAFLWSSECLEYFSEAESFVGAEAKCQKLGGHLVSIKNAIINSLVSYILNSDTEEDPPKDIWVGGHLVAEAEWKWTDKTAFDYTNWNETSESKQKCMTYSMPSKLWDADDCDEEKPFICKVPSNPPRMTFEKK